MYKLLLDTNVLVDYYLGREPGCSACVRIINQAQDRHAIYVSALSLKDVYYLVSATLKHQQRAAGALTEQSARSCNEVAWSCVRQALEFCVVANAGQGETLDAFVCRSVHDDFEDDLQLAVARALRVDFLVTGDEKLAAHSAIAALSAERMANLLEAEAAG